jgi:predicted hotdog family 3-hydroxylacyl-ACP dehydratase
VTQDIDIAALIPHGGDMCLLDRVVEWDSGSIHCTASSHRAPGNPLASEGVLAAICGVEYAAQAMAVHGALRAPAGLRPRLGYLASLRGIVCDADRLDDCSADLDVRAVQVHAEEQRVIYDFTLSCEGRDVLSGRAVVVLDVAT